jgi:hypothetical protein
VSTASAVHHTLQGAVIPSSGRGGMRIQYPLLVYNNLVHNEIQSLIFSLLIAPSIPY